MVVLTSVRNELGMKNQKEKELEPTNWVGREERNGKMEMIKEKRKSRRKRMAITRSIKQTSMESL